MRLGLRQLVLVLAMLPAGLLALALGIYFTNVQLNDLTRSYQVIGNNLTRQLSQLLEYPLYTGDRDTIRQLADNLIEDEQVAAVTVHDRDGTLLVHRGATDQLTADSRLGFETEIRATRQQFTGLESLLPSGTRTQADDPLLGHLRIALSESSINERRYSVMLHGSMITGAALLLTLLLGWWASDLITRPLAALIHTVRRFREGDMRARAKPSELGEVGTLQRGFNEMADSVQHAQDRLQEEVEIATRELQQTLEAVEIKNVELDLARKRAIAASHVKSEFLANMSHEIRTPMNAIVGFTQLLEKTPLDADQREYLRTIQQSAGTLLKLLEDVLNLSRIEAGKLHLDEYEFDPLQLAEETLNLVAANAYRKQLEIVCKPDNGLPQRVRGDGGKLQQVLLNLLHNAVKFTQQGTISLSVGTDEKDERLQWLFFAVSDTGAGMSPEQLEQLFQPFTQLESSATKSHGGAGLGLVICKKLAEAMGGEISADSRPGAGTTFSLRLPFRRIKTAADPVRVAAPSDMKGARVALYEHHPATATALRLKLQHWGLRTWQTSRLDKLIGELSVAGEHYDGVILGLDHAETRYGDNLHQLWNSLPARPRCLILANSVDRSVHRRFEKMLGGVCLPKHIDSSTLRKTLARTLELPDQAPSEESEADRTIDLASLCVLVIEDNRINMRLVVAMLESLGISAMQATSGEGALQRLAERKPDIVLLDLHLPDMSGIELAAKLLATAGADLPLIALTASSDTDLRQEAERAGIRRVLVKPVDEETLRQALVESAEHARPASDPEKPAQENAKSRPDSGTLDRELRKMLGDDLPDLRDKATTALQERNLDTLKDAVHRINGSAAFCKLHDLREAVSALEGEIDRQNWTAILSEWPELDRVLDRTIKELKNFNEDGGRRQDAGSNS